jgi:hypothetical protein
MGIFNSDYIANCFPCTVTPCFNEDLNEIGTKSLE